MTELRRNLNLLIISVTFGIAFFTIYNGPPLAGFIRSLRPGNTVYGLIMAMPVFGAVIQVFGAYAIENSGKRKRIFIISGLLQRLMLIPVSLVPLVLPDNYPALQVTLVIIFIFASSAAGSLNSVSFFSWIGCLIPADIKGRFFGKRAMVYTVSSVITAMAAGKFLDYMPGKRGFAILFFIVSILGVIDILIFLWIKDQVIAVPKDSVKIKNLLVEPFKNKNYMKFIAFITSWNFGVNFSGPFFMVYMLEHLRMTFFTTTLITQVIPGLFTIFFIRMMGGMIDKHGSKKILRFCGLIITFFPLFWLFATPDNYLPAILVNILGGVLWPSFEMTAINLSIWLAPEKNRSIYIAVYTLIASATGILLANLFGGLFMDITGPVIDKINFNLFPGQKLSNFHILFAVSTLLRLLSIVFLAKRFKGEEE